LILRVYRATRSFPIEERFGLQSHTRRAAVSIAANLVEGCARRTKSDYARFVDIAFASSRELSYLISLAARLEYWPHAEAARLARDGNFLCGVLARLRASLGVLED